MKRVLNVFFIVLIFSTKANSQIKTAEVGIDGLTCSMCSYSVENSIRRLSYVSDVKMDLNKNIAEVTFTFNSTPDMNELARQVKNSGFSVRHITILIPEGIKISEKGTFTYQGKSYLILNYKNGFWRKKPVRFLGKNFMPKPEYKSLLSGLSKEQKKFCNSENSYLIKIED